ncbi:kinesin motor domain protein [Teladorsagia circumcincta]|uniref:Kinesin motor domain protein n=1 Tax=Teladorsagia circumcincta TaxID=45464 RepID=A0A2G9TYM7_TELCI|nr:kinesin motor domain protein [Teladorsagia circumcincta]
MSNPLKKVDKINVRVAVRVRPMSDGERADNATSIVKVEEKKMMVTCKSKAFSAFDKVGWWTISDMVGRLWTFNHARKNLCRNGISAGGTCSRWIQLHLVCNTEEYSVRVSYLELYNEELFDLLAPTTDDRERLRIFDDPSRKGMVVISGAEELPVKDRSEVYTLLKRGAEKRTTAATLMNMSSRESKLTRLLQDSLGGSTITSIIATLSPASSNYEEYNEEIEKLRRDLRTAREKNGIFLSQESYEGMEHEIAEKTEQLRELEGQLDAAIGKLQKFIEDQELMDEQYRELYHRNKRLEAKLRQRVDELDGTRKARETVFDQQLDLEDWWAKEAILSNLIAQNKQVVVAARAKIMAEVTSCCSAISEFLEKGVERREAINKSIGGMESEDNDILTRNVSEIETWASTFQGREVAAHQAIAWANETVDKTLDTVTDRMSCCADVLKETYVQAKEANASLAETVNCFGEEVSARSRCISSNVTDLLNSIRERTGTIETVVEENENIRKTEQENQATFDHTVAQGLRDRLGEVSKEMLAMVEENYLSPKKTGRTPQKSHYPVPRDSEIPHVPKKEKILASKDSGPYTPSRASFRTRESLLEVQNICISPDTLVANRRSRLEDIGEESVSLSGRTGYEESKADLEN